MNTAKSQEVSLAEQLRISPDETKAVAKRINFMLHVQEKKDFTFENIDTIYNEWQILADRLKKGRAMLDSQLEGKRLRDVTNLYNFLLSQLGLYDQFFKQALSEAHYRHLQNTILSILDA